jgi:uncharacterized protein (DUF2141 family)
MKHAFSTPKALTSSLIALSITLSIASRSCLADSVTLIITSDTKSAEKIYLAVFTETTQAGFPSGTPFFTTRLVPNSAGAITYYIPDLPPGRLAVSAFHDLNGNQDLDTNALGMPIEPYGPIEPNGFSNNVHGLFGPPNFSDVAIQIGETDRNQTTAIRLQ